MPVNPSDYTNVVYRFDSQGRPYITGLKNGKYFREYQEMPYKRKFPYGSIGPQPRPRVTPAMRGSMAAAKFSKVKPWSTFGAARVKRGTASNLIKYGATARTADAGQKYSRMLTGYTGKGMYKRKSVLKGVVKGAKRGLRYGADALTLASLGMAAFGEPEMIPIAAAARQASNYVGRGMYNPVRARNNKQLARGNALISGSANTMPRMRNLKDETGSLIVSHRERLSDVFAPVDAGFHQDTFTVSPGIEKTFPWLSQIAANYEEYELMQCVFEYDGHSLVGINDTLEVQGSLVMATQMNVKDKPFRDRHEMERFPHASKCAQHGSMAHGVECDPKKISGDGHRYIRLGGLAKDEDARDFDHAKFTVGQYNTPSELFGKEIGQLYVFYTVKLIKPKISSGRGDAISTFRTFCADAATGRAFGRLADEPTQDATNGMQVASRNSLPMTVKYVGNDLQCTFDPYVSGTFRVTVALKASTDISGLNAHVDAAGSATVVQSQVATTWAANAAGTQAVLITDVQVRPRDLASSSLASIVIDGLDSVSTLTETSLEITEINILEQNSSTDAPELKLIA